MIILLRPRHIFLCLFELYFVCMIILLRPRHIFLCLFELYFVCMIILLRPRHIFLKEFCYLPHRLLLRMLVSF